MSCAGCSRGCERGADHERSGERESAAEPIELGEDSFERVAGRDLPSDAGIPGDAGPAIAKPPRQEPFAEEPPASEVDVPRDLPPSAEDTAAARSDAEPPPSGENEDEGDDIVEPDIGPTEPIDAGPLPGEPDVEQPIIPGADAGPLLDAPISPGDVLDATPPPEPLPGEPGGE